MQKVEDVKGLGGMLNGFRDLVKDDRSVTFVGSPGFCTPFATFLGYPIREKELAFVPGLEEGRAKKLVATPYGMELGDSCPANADTLAILGGMAMPKIGVTVEEMKQFLDRVKFNGLVGVCFMGIFDKAGWCQKLDFDYVMNINLEGDISKK